MPLSAGEHLGPYEILAPIGKGGMGEVYRAHDPRLKRDVAIKVSEAQFSERFEREAQAIAALNHPNICHIYDVGPNYLVMEYIVGSPLKGPLAVDQALKYAVQICDALDAAHKRGITHRDLKPANILVTKAGVKLLDFGLAKIAQATNPPSDATLTMALTGKNEIVGTLYYMSPEQLQAQANGQEIDGRSDIFSFGLVLYEILTGKRAFEGSSPASVIAAIMERPAPSITDVAPAALDRVLRKCLEKDPDNRWQSARDLKDELQWISTASSPAPAAAAPARSQPGLASVAIVLALVAAAVWVFAQWNRSSGVQRTAARFTIALPPGQEVTTYPAITRDGQTIAYVTQKGNDDSQLYLRDLDSFEARPVAGSNGAKEPFFSPDGKWVAFFAKGHLQKAEVTGGAPIRLAEATYPQGGTWNEDNTIIYTPSLGSGLMRVAASGGTPEALTKPDGAANGYAHVFPQALPGGRKLLFTIWGQTQGNAVLSLDSRRWDLVLSSPSLKFGVFEPTNGSAGRLLMVDQSAGILAAPFDSAHPALTSADTTILNNVYYDVENEARGWLAISNTHTIVYVPANPGKMSLVWVDREGKIESFVKDQDVYREAILSPDGTKAVVRHGQDLWVHDLQRGIRSPLTSGQASNVLPMWSLDGSRVLYGSNRAGDWDIYTQPADGSGPGEALMKRPHDQFPYSFLPDGTLLFLEIHPETSRDLWTLSPDGKATPVRVTSFNEGEGRFAPGQSGGSHWLAYTSDESGRREIYVQSYPDGKNRRAVSSGGGSQPRWSPDGKELYYVAGEAVVAVSFHPDGSFGAPRKLFDRSNFFLSDYRFQSYNLAPDGKRFLMIRRDEGSVPRQLNVILNWSDGSRQSRPGGE